MAPIDFGYDLEEIVQMAGVGPVSLKSVAAQCLSPYRHFAYGESTDFAATREV
jgi:hypothetical protein